jgi:O-acetyl-ADP-ribose deacetylase (regulator of RNase III)
MPDELPIKNSLIRLTRGDITDLPVEAIVFYARPDLVLGSGFGAAIAVRGGPKIQEELKKFGSIATGEAVVTSAGNMKAQYIIHAVGPRFQEEDTEGKLRTTTLNVLRRAEEKGVKQLAFPAMGAGFYGIPLDLCARITLGVVKKNLEGQTGLEEVIFCLRDSREYKPFQEQLKKMGGNP